MNSSLAIARPCVDEKQEFASISILISSIDARIGYLFFLIYTDLYMKMAKWLRRRQQRKRKTEISMCVYKCGSVCTRFHTNFNVHFFIFLIRREKKHC